MRVRTLVAGFAAGWLAAALLAVFFRTFRQVGYKELLERAPDTLSAIVGVNVLLAACALPFVVMFVYRKKIADGYLWRSGKKAAIAIAGCSVLDGLGILMLFEALRIGSLSVVGPLRNTGVVFAFIIGAFVGQRVAWQRKLLGSLVIVAGVFAVKGVDTDSATLPAIFALGSAAAFAATSWFTQMALHKKHADMSASLFWLLNTLVLTIACALYVWSTDATATQRVYEVTAFVITDARVFLFVVVCGTLGSVLAALSLRTGEIAVVAAIFPLEILTTIIAGALFFGEDIRGQIFGGTILLLGVLLVAWPKSR